MSKKLVTLMFGCCAAVIPSVAFAADSDPSNIPASQLIDLLMTGKYMAAVGGFLIAAVTAMRAGLGRFFPWFSTKAGGYVMGFGSAALLYLGVSFYDGKSLSLGVIAAALAAGWTAAGGWEHLSDLLSWLRPAAPQPPVAVVAGQEPAKSPGAALPVVLALLIGSGCMVTGGLVISACSAAKNVGTIVIDCAKADAAETSKLLDALKPLLSGQPISWSSIESTAFAAGETIGGCVLAELVESHLLNTKSVSIEETWLAHGALNDARMRWNPNIVWHTKDGKDL